MTIRIQRPDWKDRILGIFGKKRAVWIPDGLEPHGYLIAGREGFLRALIRRKGKSPAPGWVYPEEIIPGGWEK